MTCTHEGEEAQEMLRAKEGGAEKVIVCQRCVTPDDIDVETYEAMKAALPESYGADLVQQVEAAQMEQSLEGNDQGMGGTDA